MPMRQMVLATASLLLMLVAATAAADQKIKTKSNIKNDRVASTCAADCAAAGQNWARENQVTDPAACDSSSAAFSEGCKSYLQQQASPKVNVQDMHRSQQ